MTHGSNELFFYYHADGRPMMVTFNGTTYQYVLNLQGDVVALLNSSGTAVVNYYYDAWGKLLSCTGSMASTLGLENPLRYRGYVYDRETGLYYLQSRYYNPTIGRFINADNQLPTGDLSGINLFSYCGNNPVMLSDPTGHAPEWWQWAVSGLLVVGGIALVATGFGGVAGGTLICAGANSIIGSYVSEETGGSSTAGWVGGLVTGAACGAGAGVAGNLLVNATNTVGAACLTNLAAGGAVAFASGAAGSLAGQGISAAIDGKSLDEKELAYSAIATGSINCLSGMGSGIGSALNGMPAISTTTTAMANTINAAATLVAETICDTFGTIISLWP